MKSIDIALAAGFATQVAVTAVAVAFILRPQWFARFASDAFLIRHSLWDECDGEPMNIWAEEFARRDGAFGHEVSKGEEGNG